MGRDLILAIGSALFAAAVMTFGDYVWASQSVEHRVMNGLLHGAGLCLALGIALGAPAGRPLVGALGGIVIGLIGAVSFYVLAPLLRYYAMFVSWMLLWILLALLHGRLRGALRVQSALVRGLLAAIGSGIAFYAISGMWMRWNPAAINYADHFARWTVAFLPGFLALHLASAPAATRR